MPDEKQENNGPDRRNGASASFLNQVNLAAKAKVKDANTERAERLAEAHRNAELKLRAAHSVTADRLGANIESILARYGPILGDSGDTERMDKGWVVVDPAARPRHWIAIPPVDTLAVDVAARRVYFIVTAEDRQGTGKIPMLMSADLNGGDQRPVATFASNFPSDVGQVAIDLAEGAAFWILRSNKIVRSPLEGTDDPTETAGIDIRQFLPGGPGNLSWSEYVIPAAAALIAEIPDGHISRSIALDRINRKIYWCNGVTIGSVNYDGTGLRSLVQGTWANCRILAVDPVHRDIYYTTGASAYRFNEDDRSMECILPLGQVSDLASPGIAVDVASHLVYWVRPHDNLLLRAPIRGYAGADDVGALIGRPLGPLPTASTYVSTLVLITDSDQASQALAASNGRKNRALVDAPGRIARAHQEANSRRDTAHATVESKHAEAQTSIADARQAAAGKRMAAQEAARLKQAEAALLPASARAQADSRRPLANATAQARLAPRREEAARRAQEAQSNLKAQRQRLQNS